MTLTTADYLLRGRGLGRGEARHLAAPHLAQADGAPPPLPGTLRVVEHWGGARSTSHIAHYTLHSKQHNTAQHFTHHNTAVYSWSLGSGYDTHYADLNLL